MLQMEMDTKGKDSWVLQVESLLVEGEIGTEESPDGFIHRVPKSLLGEDTKVLYHPQVISFGPYHFTKKEKLDNDEIELLKSEVARYVHHKIKDAFNSSEKETYAKREHGLKSVIKSFEEKEGKVKKSYAREFEVTGEVCAWMIARDACFIVQVLEKFRGDHQYVDESVHTPVFQVSIDSILSRRRQHSLMTEIVKDMLKMENQLPFWALQEIRPDIEDWLHLALKNLSPIEEVDLALPGKYKTNSHILQLLHDYIVDNNLLFEYLVDVGMLHDYNFEEYNTVDGESVESVNSQQRPSSAASTGDSIATILYDSACRVCKYCGNLLRGCIEWLFILVITLVALIPSVFVLLIMLVIDWCIYPRWERWKHVPTVEELKRLGVKFKKLEGKELGIRNIKFKESNRTLYLPQCKVDNRSEVILRNLIALEICSTEKVKPITRYAILMNDLVNTSGDVGILRQEGVITSELGSDEEIARFWNSMVTSTEVRSYEPIDKVVSSIHDYRNKWWKVLWAQFIMAHCSKPWLFLSLLGGVSLLLLTIVQVLCLFESCQIK